jgi:hypothetical protein
VISKFEFGNQGKSQNEGDERVFAKAEFSQHVSPVFAVSTKIPSSWAFFCERTERELRLYYL